MFRSLLSVLLRSLFAILAGIVVGAFLSVATDAVLSALGWIPLSNDVWWMLQVALTYRAVYTVLAGYVTAGLAPNRPLGHAVTLGVIGVIVTIIGTIANWDRSLGNAWYPVALIIITLPCCWLGGRLRVR
jgi:hypothetical protein